MGLGLLIALLHLLTICKLIFYADSWRVVRTDCGVMMMIRKVYLTDTYPPQSTL